MKSKTDRLVARLALIGLPAILLVLYLVSTSVAQDEGLFSSPILTPQPTPLPSAEAQVALRYIAKQYGIPQEQLVIVNEHRREYLELHRTFRAFTLLDVVGDHFFTLLVDLADQSVVEDVAAIEQGEETAYREQYGKLEPALHERLEDASDDELIEVAIWIAGKPRRTQREMFDELAARFPEARTAMDQRGKPFDVQDDELRAEIRRAYSAMVAANAEPLVQPMTDLLQAQGYAFATYDGLPSITTALPKHFILSLAERPDVGQIYLIEGEGSLLLDSAIPTQCVPAVWQRGYDGTEDISVAVVETDNVDFQSASAECLPGTSNCFRHQGQTWPGVDGLGYHATLVASAIASNHSTYRGMAPDTTIHSIGMNSDNEAGLVEALEWALAPPPDGAGADIANISWGKGIQRGMRWSDRAVDYWALSYNAMVVAAAGNQPQCGLYLCSPAKGWNVLSVGAYDDKNNPNWSDDVMAASSSYINPYTDQDREKPEVVAPGIQITGVGWHANLYTESGTSYSAPQVAGLAALLADRDSDLLWWPEASRAIIMASAVHDIEEPGDIPTGEELKDGAGGIDAALADTVAQYRSISSIEVCPDLCWWGIAHDNTYFPVHTFLYRSFKATRGERVRVAISWQSNADCPDQAHCSYDRLDTNLDLGVLDPDGDDWVEGAWSASWDNNYELVDFKAPKTGVYSIGVWKEKDDEDPTGYGYFGMALVKDATYVPDVRSDYSGWDSDIFIRNDGAEPRKVTWSLSFPNGSSAGDATYSDLPSAKVWRHDPAHWNFLGSAIVDGGEDVSVVVVSRRGTSGAVADTGFTAGGSGDPTFEQTGATLYAPAIYNNIYSWNSTVEVMNTGSEIAHVAFRFKGRTGYGDTTYSHDIPANGRYELPASTVLGSGAWVGSLVVKSTNGQPLAVQVHELNNNQMARSYQASASGSSTLYLPAAYKNQWGMTSSLVIQNLHSSQAATARLDFYDRDGTYKATHTLHNIGSRRAVGLGLGSLGSLGEAWTGWIKVISQGGQPLATVMQTSCPAGFYAHTAASRAGRAVILPRAARNAGGHTTGWTVLNTSDTSGVSVTAHYYDLGGNESISPPPTYWLPPLGVQGRHQSSDPLPDGWEGSIVLEANQPLIAIMREDTGTTSSAYSGIVR